jgi:PAS domain S-box-containing protein
MAAGRDSAPGDLTDAILETAPDAVIVLDDAGAVVEFNPAAERIFGYRRAEAIGDELAQLILSPGARKLYRRGLARVRARGDHRLLPRPLELAGKRSDGDEFAIEMTITRVPAADPPWFIAYVRDVTDRQRHERELRRSLAGERAARSEAERGRFGTRRLIAQTLGTEERERQRLARELHDGPVQDLLAAQLELRGAIDEAPGPVETAMSAITDAVEQLREAIFDLYPPVLDRLGLIPAVEELANEFSKRTAAELHVDLGPGAEGTHDRLLFSIARELLSNAVRHSRARHVYLDIRREGDHVLLQVRDDGIGMSESRREEALRAGHIGLASSAERVEALGGTFLVASEESGTLVRALLPARRREDRSGDTPPRAPQSDVPDRERRSLRI